MREHDNALINNIRNNSRKKIYGKLMQPLYHKPICEQNIQHGLARSLQKSGG